MQNSNINNEYNNIDTKSVNIYQQYQMYTEQNFIYSILFNYTNDKELNKYIDILHLKQYGFILNIEFVEDSDSGKNAQLSSEDLYHCIKSSLDKQVNSVVGPIILNRVIVIISEEGEECFTDLAKQEVFAYCEKLINDLKKQIPLSVQIGIGTVQKIENIHSSYEEALKALRYEESALVRHIDNVIDEAMTEHINYMIAEHKLIENIKQGKYEALDMFSVVLDLIKPLGLDEKKNKVIELLVLSCQAARLEGSNEGSFLNYLSYFKELLNIKEEMLASWAYKKFQYIIKAVRHRKKEKVSTCIAAAIEYIDDHYREELSLDDVSRYVNISPQYLSKLFKEETNFNFVEWVTNVRINHAKELMNETDMTIKEICFLVGYNDPNYFSRIFKRIVGCSPTEYAKNKEND